MKLILASSSPRRRQLLLDAGYTFERMDPDETAEQDPPRGLMPVEMVRLFAWRKAAQVSRRVERGRILAADTVAECKGQVLGKPRDREHARAILEFLGGQVHLVHTGVCLWRQPENRYQLQSMTTTLSMKSWDRTTLDAYLDSGQWIGKAGAFGYQDGLDWVQVLSGSETNVVGLPMELVRCLLEGK